MRIKSFSEFLPNGAATGRVSLKAGSPGDDECNSNAGAAEGRDSLDAPCDNSGYLWFFDYNPLFREGSYHHPSVLSSISASYKGIGDFASRFEFTSRYNDIARNLDANLAEADMESFKTEDIHALLMTANLPQETNVEERIRDSNPEGEMIASVSSSLLEKFRFDSSFSADGSTQGDDSVGSVNSMSLCKSELLFSPVREPHANAHYSVDSLDSELPAERDLMLTCRANKHNYTIAFEGSINSATNYGEEMELVTDQFNDKSRCLLLDNDERTRKNLELLERCKQLTDKLTLSMARSDLGLTTWSKLTKMTNHSPIRRQPSGNNNEDCNENSDINNQINNSVIKSQSLPNLSRKKVSDHLGNLSILSTSTIDSFSTHHKMSDSPICMKVYDASNSFTSHDNSNCEPMSTSSNENQTYCNKEQSNKFNLVKLYMKQKSASNDGLAKLDHSHESKCWAFSEGEQNDDSCAQNKSVNDKRTTKNTYPKICEDIIPENFYNNNTDKNALYATVEKSSTKVLNTKNISKYRSASKPSFSQSSDTRVSISSCSESESTQISKMAKMLKKETLDSKATSTNFDILTIDKAMQTSHMQISNVNHDREILKVVERSFLEKLKEGDCEKPVYVLYPNYALPDISFLNNKNVYLRPLKVTPKSNVNKKPFEGKRPFSCNDIEALKKKGLGHIKDWDSLNFLLPKECKELLSEIPELVKHLQTTHRHETVCGDLVSQRSCSKIKTRPLSCDCNNLTANTVVSSSSSIATQPSSGYRGSSTILTDSSAQNSPAVAGNFNPLFVYRYESPMTSEVNGISDANKKKKTDRILNNNEKTAPRPPLPKSILRKSLDKSRKTNPSTKRYSMFEIDDFVSDPATCSNQSGVQKCKRRSLPEPYYQQNQIDIRKNNDVAAKKLSQQFLDAAEKDAPQSSKYSFGAEYFKDEGVGTESSLDSGKSNELKTNRPSAPTITKTKSRKIEQIEFPPPDAILSNEDLEQLEEFLMQSGISFQDIDGWDQTHVQKVKNLAEIPICEEAEMSLDESITQNPNLVRPKFDLVDVSQKRALVSNVTDAVEMIIQHFAPATSQAELFQLGDSKLSPVCAKIALNALCPALYAVFRDGLKENIETSFGAINNSVWQMVESTARQGSITKSLNELVLRINSEDAVSEGLVKFNAFVLGLLNARTVDAWVSYIRTRESILQKHYSADSLILAACVGEPRCRALFDSLMASLEPLKLLPFSLDLMFEMRELHRSFKRIENEMRAASRLESSGESHHKPSSAGSGRVSSHSGHSHAPSHSSGGKFRRLQLKWELLSNIECPSGETSPATPKGSRIPRPVTSPVRPPNNTVISPSAKTTQRSIPVAVKKATSPSGTVPRLPLAKPPTKKPPQPAASTRRLGTVERKVSKIPNPAANKTVPKTNIASRAQTSRADQLERGVGGASARPASLPHGRAPPPAAQRRAASATAPRTTNAHPLRQKPKFVRTLWHRLPTDSGHLAFNEGERLKLILEVDDKLVLCCRGGQKGLVPKDAVIEDTF